MSDFGEEAREQKKTGSGRRDFLKWVGGFGLSSMMSGKGGGSRGHVKGVDVPVNLEKTRTEVIVNSIVNFSSIPQKIVTEHNSATGEEIVVDCDDPAFPPGVESPVTGYQTDKTDFDNSKIQPVELETKKGKFSILANVTPEEGRINHIKQWEANPNYIDDEAWGRSVGNKEVEHDIDGIPVLVVHRKSVRTDRWVKDGDGCRREFDDSPAFEPKTLFAKLSESLRAASGGIVNFQQAAYVQLTESESPLTRDANLAPQALIDVYGKTANHKQLIELGNKYGAKVVMVFGGPSTGMWESYKTNDQTGEKFTIFGFNTEGDYGSALHSVCHHFEYELMAKWTDVFYAWSGRQEEYGVPYLTMEQQKRNYLYALGDGNRRYLPTGMGSVHFPPNAINHYQCDSMVKVRDFMDPEGGFIDSSAWGGNHDGYLKWWVSRMPKPFLKSLVPDMATWG